MLAESLKKAGQLDSCGGIIRISKIQDRAPTTAHRAYFIQEIRNNHLRRQLIEEASRAIEKAYNCQDDAAGLMDEVEPHPRAFCLQRYAIRRYGFHSNGRGRETG